LQKSFQLLQQIRNAGDVVAEKNRDGMEPGAPSHVALIDKETQEQSGEAIMGERELQNSQLEAAFLYSPRAAYHYENEQRDIAPMNDHLYLINTIQERSNRIQDSIKQQIRIKKRSRGASPEASEPVRSRSPGSQGITV